MQVQHIVPILVVLGLLSILMNIYSNFVYDFLKSYGILPESTSIRQLKQFLWWIILPLLLLSVSFALFTLSTSAPPVATITESTNTAPPLAQTSVHLPTSRSVLTATVANIDINLILKKEINVPANNSGESTGILVKKGDVVRFNSTGRWCWGGGNDCSSANGTPGRPGKDEQPSLVRGSFYGALLGSISDDPLFMIGIANEVTANRDGEIVLRINDPIYSDNSGYLLVEVEIYRKSN